MRMRAGHHWRKLAPVQILALVAEYREREDEQVCPQAPYTLVKTLVRS